MIDKYGKYDANRIDTSAKLMIETGVYKLVK